jgi:hypothetical protein
MSAMTEYWMAERWAGDGMVRRGIALLAVVFAGFAGGTGRLQAQLPSLSQSPWLGFFAGHQGTRGMCGILADGSLYYNHADNLGSVSSGSPHHIYPAVQETLPDGKFRVRRLLPETLKTETEPTDKPDKVTYSGQVKSGATIDVTVEFTRRDISIGGRIVDPGPGKNPQSFILYTQAPPYYLMYGESKTLKEGTPEEKKKLEQQIARQRTVAAKESLLLRKLDGKSIKQPLLDSVDLSSPDFNGDGFNEVEADFEWLKDRKIRITATEGSRMMLSGKKRPIFKHHFYITWMQDSAAKSPGKSRMVITTL